MEPGGYKKYRKEINHLTLSSFLSFSVDMLLTPHVQRGTVHVGVLLFSLFSRYAHRFLGEGEECLRKEISASPTAAALLVGIRGLSFLTNERKGSLVRTK